jgi:hypothetical protein
LSRVCLFRYVPPSGFLNLLAACSSRRPAAFFVKATSTCGVCPSGGFPASQPFRLSAASCPLAVSCPHPTACAAPGFGPAASGLCSAQQSVAPRLRPKALAARPFPSWASSPLGFSLSPLGGSASGAASSLGLEARPFTLVRGPALRSVPAGSTACLSRDCRPFRGSLTSSRLLPLRVRAGPGLSFRLEHRAWVTPAPRALFGHPLPLPELGRFAFR